MYNPKTWPCSSFIKFIHCLFAIYSIGYSCPQDVDPNLFIHVSLASQVSDSLQPFKLPVSPMKKRWKKCVLLSDLHSVTLLTFWLLAHICYSRKHGSDYACVGCLWVLWLPPIVLRHACLVNRWFLNLLQVCVWLSISVFHLSTAQIRSSLSIILRSK